VSVVTIVMMMSLIATLPLESVMNHPRAGDGQWIRGGRPQRIEKSFPCSLL
jgi:hypothetical protein